MEKLWATIDNLVREYTWEANQIHSLSVKIDVWDEIATAKYREGQLVLFSPSVLDFYKDKKEEWSVKERMDIGGFLGPMVNSKRPLTRDLTRERQILPPSYNFSSLERLALVCDLNQRTSEHSAPGSFYVKYSLVPLREDEYKLTKNPESQPSYQELNNFDEIFLRNNLLDIQNIPIEIIMRPGEIDRTKLRQKQLE